MKENKIYVLIWNEQLNGLFNVKYFEKFLKIPKQLGICMYEINQSFLQLFTIILMLHIVKTARSLLSHPKAHMCFHIL